DHSKETRSGNTTHADNSLPEYDSFCFEIKPDQERLINLMKNDIPNDSSNNSLLEEVNLFLSDNSIQPDVDYFSFIFVIYPKIFPLLLSAESEDTIFDPGISD
nr:hypothetical protein [Tanacetum cinerariifolium]